MTEEHMIATRAFRDAAGRFATGVTVVTVNDGGTYRAMTANSFTSVSLDPPLLLICVDRETSMHDPIHETGAFAVNVLAEEQRPLSEMFARRGELTQPMGGAPFHVRGTGSPLLEGVIAWFECEVWREYEGGDHTIYVGRVVDMSLTQPDGKPLLFFGGRYRAMDGAAPGA
jgi:flavin reductase (DIM6/NTAB) family NADH-FMN oxidoreductase RutF